MSVDDYRDALPPATPLRGGEYVLEDELGRGGFAVTYAALDTELGRQAALKEFFPPGCGREGLRVTVPAPLQDEFARARDAFAQEARALARFSHPHIVGVYATWSENETAYLALERIRGETLLARLERVGALPPDEVLAIARQIGDALQTVHEAGLLHRDVTPGNIMLEPGEDALSTGRAVLLDFGLALESEAGSFNTRAVTRARAVGTPAYAAPEQWGRRPKTPAVDVYAFAATLYHALSGVAPPPASDRAAGEELAPLAETELQLAAWDDALGRGMALSVAQRPQSVADFVMRLPGSDDAGSNRASNGAAVAPLQKVLGLVPATVVSLAPAPPAPISTPHPGYESPRWVGALVGIAGRARGVAWSPDGQRVAVAADSRLLWVWSPNLSRFERRARARTIAAHTDWLRSVAWSPDGAYLVSGGADKTLRLWSSSFDYAPDTLEIGCEVAALDWQVRPNTPFDPARGLTLGVGGSDGRARLLRMTAGELSREPQLLLGGSVPRYNGDEVWLRGIGWAANGARLWGGGDDGMLRAWEANAPNVAGQTLPGGQSLPLQLATEFMAHPGGVRDLAVSSDGTQLATVGGYDALVKIWDSEGRLQRTLAGARGPLLTVTWIAPDVVAAGGRDRAVRLWDTTTGAQLAILPEHPAEVCCLAFSPVAPYLCAGSEREVWIWRL